MKEPNSNSSEEEELEGPCSETCLPEEGLRNFYLGASESVKERYQGALATMLIYKKKKDADPELTAADFRKFLESEKKGKGKLFSLSSISGWIKKTDHGNYLKNLLPKKTGPKKPHKMTDTMMSIMVDLMVSCYPTAAAKKKPKKPEVGSNYSAFRIECLRRGIAEKDIPCIRTLQRAWESLPTHEKKSCTLSATKFNEEFFARGTNDWEAQPYTVQIDHEVVDYLPVKDKEGNFTFSICVAVEPAFGCYLSASIFLGAMDGAKLEYALASIARFDEGFCEGFFHIPAKMMIDNEAPHITKKFNQKVKLLGINKPKAQKKKPRHRGSVERSHRQFQRGPLRELENYVRQEITHGRIVIEDRHRQEVLEVMQKALRAFIYEHNNSIKDGKSKSRIELWREAYSHPHRRRKEDIIQHLGISHQLTPGKFQQVAIKPRHHKRMLITNQHIKPGITYQVVELPGQSPQFFVFDRLGEYLGEAKLELADTPERRQTEARNRQEQLRVRTRDDEGRARAARYFKDKIDSAQLAPEESAPIIPAPRTRKSVGTSEAIKAPPMPKVISAPEPQVPVLRSFVIPDMGVSSKIAVPV